MKQATIAVDFDGTLATDAFPSIREPNLLLFDTLKKAKQDGCAIILWTCRVGDKLQEAVEFCHRHGLYFDAVNDNLPETITKHGTNCRKISADVYIDDRALYPYVETATDTIGTILDRMEEENRDRWRRFFYN